MTNRQANQVIIAAITILLTPFTIALINDYRVNRNITNCKVLGGKPIYKSQTYYNTSDSTGMTSSYEIQVFDRCSVVR
jgi:hypothetical protein